MRWCRGGAAFALALALSGCAAQATGSADGGDGAIDLGDGRPIVLGDLASDALPVSTGGAPCDPIVQDCADPMNPKCSVTVEDGVAAGRCVPQLGMNGEGASCVRLGVGPMAQGRDDCAKGLFCTLVGRAAPERDATRFCRRFCRDDTDCGMAERCMRLDGAHPADGACVPSCALYSSECPMGFACSDPIADVDGMDYFAACRTLGATSDGDTCASQLDCGAGAFCLDPNAGGNHPVCTPTCDHEHPCKTGRCVALPDLPNRGGICK